jgi:hypothetical protein
MEEMFTFESRKKVLDDFGSGLEVEFELISGKDVHTLLHQVVCLVQ